MHAPIFAMYVGPPEVKEIKLKTLNLLKSCFCLAGIPQRSGLVRTLKAYHLAYTKTLKHRAPGTSWILVGLTRRNLENLVLVWFL